ncbi:SOS response-associated peptidase [Dysgonomonas sp. HDW5B]|nr:SOS response-associated peptidase [Dysgonomonas sp. HDW5B]QIK55259.1 SOS response-associated peptidase [Dysgonomonas sp. HDW5B]
MCYYNSMSKKAKELAARYGRKIDIIEIVKEIIEEQSRINAFSNPAYPIITSDDEIQALNWGLIPFWVKPKEDTEKDRDEAEKDAFSIRKGTYNARSETIFERPSFRTPILSRRCLIPSTGYFEYHHNNDKTKTPYLIYLPDEEVFSMAGVYDSWISPKTGKVYNTFSMITTQANELTYEIHNGGKNPHRMPVIINKQDEEKWLDPKLNKLDIQSMLKPFEASLMDAYAVDRNLFLNGNPHNPSIMERV